MTQIESLLAQLPDPQRKQVENYAASLLPRRPGPTPTPRGKPNRIQLDQLDGLLVRMTSDMSDEEIEKRALNDWADAAED